MKRNAASSVSSNHTHRCAFSDSSYPIYLMINYIITRKVLCGQIDVLHYCFKDMNLCIILRAQKSNNIELYQETSTFYSFTWFLAFGSDQIRPISCLGVERMAKLSPKLKMHLSIWKWIVKYQWNHRIINDTQNLRKALFLNCARII